MNIAIAELHEMEKEYEKERSQCGSFIRYIELTGIITGIQRSMKRLREVEASIETAIRCMNTLFIELKKDTTKRKLI